MRFVLAFNLSAMDHTKVNELKGFIDTIKARPELLQLPELRFFKYGISPGSVLDVFSALGLI